MIELQIRGEAVTSVGHSSGVAVVRVGRTRGWERAQFWDWSILRCSADPRDRCTEIDQRRDRVRLLE